jgi:hypothetical protein
VLTQYLNAMARFHNYSFGNIMLIVRQRAVRCGYTSLESMNMRSCAIKGRILWHLPNADSAQCAAITCP